MFKNVLAHKATKLTMEEKQDYYSARRRRLLMSFNKIMLHPTFMTAAYWAKLGWNVGRWDRFCG